MPDDHRTEARSAAIRHNGDGPQQPRLAEPLQAANANDPHALACENKFGLRAWQICCRKPTAFQKGMDRFKIPRFGSANAAVASQAFHARTFRTAAAIGLQSGPQASSARLQQFSVRNPTRAFMRSRFGL